MTDPLHRVKAAGSRAEFALAGVQQIGACLALAFVCFLGADMAGHWNKSLAGSAAAALLILAGVLISVTGLVRLIIVCTRAIIAEAKDK